MKNKGAFSPTDQEFSRLAKNHDIVPVYREFLSDVETPVTAFLKLANKETSCYLLESVEQGEKIGRYSIIGLRPSKTVIAKNNEDISCEVEKLVTNSRLASLPEIPSFAAGFVGYLSYENIAHFEKIALRVKPELPIPSGVFLLADRIIVFDHLMRSLKLIVLCHTKNGAKQAFQKGQRALDEMTRQLKRNHQTEPRLHTAPKESKATRKPIKSNLTQAAFKRQVEKAKEYIKSGDCIQVVLSQRFDLGKVKDSFEVYRTLRALNPSPYMFYFKHKELALIGSSPEVLVKKTGQQAIVRPIAGTRRRGNTEAEDLALEKELLKCKKELAEHLMLVDLGRNDLGRVCKYKSIKVHDYAHVERFSHVMHLVSEVSGQLNANENAFSLLRSTFPAGTVSGAPKIRAIEIIDELEPIKRGPYSGCLGYFGFNGDMDMCIMIRTILVSHDRAYVQAGAGIVYDSKPEHEYKETLNKARALLRAVELTRKNT